jgi:hypothetical protein
VLISGLVLSQNAIILELIFLDKFNSTFCVHFPVIILTSQSFSTHNILKLKDFFVHLPYQKL